MSNFNPSKILRLHGFVEQIDLINREVELVAEPARHVVHVPSDCEVFLHGERVKLRMLQPGDRVEVACRAEAGALIASRLEA